MSDREPIQRIDFDALKAQGKPFTLPAKPPLKDYSVLRLTLRDLKFLYDIGVSCE